METGAALPLARMFAMRCPVAQLPGVELVENRRRSVAMLQPGEPALNRDEALRLLEQLVTALKEVWPLRVQVTGPVASRRLLQARHNTTSGPPTPPSFRGIT